MLEEHLKNCPKSKSNELTESIEEFVDEQPEEAITESYTVENTNCIDENSIEEKKLFLNGVDDRLMILEQDIASVRTALNEETRQRHRLIVDVGSLRKRAVISDEWTGKVGEVLTALKKCLNEETESRCIDVQQVKIDIGRLLLQYQVNIY